MLGLTNLRSELNVFLLIATANIVMGQSGKHFTPAWNFNEARQFDFYIGELNVNNSFIQGDGS